MSARDEAIEMIRRICPPHLDADEYGLILGEKFDAYRAEVLAEAAQAEITPPDNDTVARRAHLAHAIGRGGRWKSGTVVRWYEANGYTGCTVHTARGDLAALHQASVTVQHDEPGVRYYTALRQGGDRRG